MQYLERPEYVHRGLLARCVVAWLPANYVYTPDRISLDKALSDPLLDP